MTISPAARQSASSTSRAGMVGWAMYDFANSSFAAVIQTFVFAAYFTRSVAVNEKVGTSQWGAAAAAAAVVIAIGGPILGAAADQGGRRKPWIIVFTLLAVALTAALWFVRPTHHDVMLALVLVTLGTIAAEYATIFYNAMLGDLAPADRLGRWSGWGWACGYVGGVLCLIVALFVFVMPKGAWLGLDAATAQPVRATFLLTAGWFLLFAIPMMVFTPDTQGTGKRFTVAARDGLTQLWESIKEVRQYGHIVRFLIARMIYIDGLATTFLFGGIYASGTFHMTATQILEFGIALNVTAALGAAAFSWIDDYLGSRNTIVLSLAGLIVFGAGILTARSSTLFWAFGLALGVFVGPAQAASRSYLTHVAPRELRSQMFGLFALSGKATAFLGPLLVSSVTYAASSQRAGMSVILGFFLVGMLLMFTVPAASKVRASMAYEAAPAQAAAPPDG